MSRGTVYLSLSLGLSLLHFCDPYFYYTPERMREKFLRMDRELTIDAITKIKQVQHMRARYSKNPVYHVGELVYLLRTKYVQMLRLYFRCLADQEKMTHHELIYELTRLQKLSTDINHAAEAVTEYMDELDRTEEKEKKKSPLRYLDSADRALRQLVYRRNEQIDRAYPQKNPLRLDVFEDDRSFSTTNWTELLIQKAVPDDIDMAQYDPELILM